MVNNRTTPIHIVASDLDGTLLQPNHQLSPFTQQTLKQLHDSGYIFVFATGRHHVDVAGIREIAAIPAYMVTSNGARVHDPQDNLIFSHNVPEHLVQSIIDMVKQEPDININLYRNDDWLINKKDEALKRFNSSSGFSFQLFDVDNAPTTGISKLFFTHPNQSHEYLAKFEKQFNERFGDQVNVAFSTPECLEIMAGDVSKGEALEVVADKLGYTLDNCIAFGDGMNDVEMLSMVGKGLVMGTSHQRVFSALPENEVIGSNTQDAVAHYLKSNLLD
ncbi:Cof-type HAD-IIB family hydrolase [Vibrio sp. S4M6]|uniref:Cof-type HAD-IIB family hydrolase n=1 Tax=Vibrio sinus TaxID=2946865 RepID=UPI002029FDC7|nr:Cof-type HAD-IIB family hydrolase [Vibrio sinus]MCL9783556.1 Cof-type HAD-IIB family hydrolase [Vibrio sinus]